MAHFAKINENNFVEQVIVVHNNELLDNGIESESKGIAFCQSLFDGNWIQTSYNTKGNQHPNGKPFRKNHAIPGSYWDGIGFCDPQPYPSWIKNIDTYIWESPIPYPNDGEQYIWDENTTSWLLLPPSN